jgi:hypothetical protein
VPRVSAEDVILGIIRHADGEWNGKTKLCKAFYFAHLYYADAKPDRLTNWPIVRMPRGPGIDNGDGLLEKMVDDGLLEVELVHEGPYPDIRYRLIARARSLADLVPDAELAIKDACEFCKDKTASELSALTHERSRSWQTSKDGETLDITIDLIPDNVYFKEKARIQEANKLLSTIFGAEVA